MVRTADQLGEFGVINQFRKLSPSKNGVIQSIGDDTAVLTLSKDKYTLFTTDLLLEGKHFTLDVPAKKIGYKALACSISDIAAMGGLAKYAVISLGIPKSLPVKLITEIYQGLNACAKKFNVAIVGGDTVRNNKIIINVALTGEVRKKNLTLRSTAHPGDYIFVTGKLGGSLKSGRHYKFIPRIKESQYITRYFRPSAMIDISDGFIPDLNHICQESKVGAIVNEANIPKHRDCSIKDAFYDGEDFELIFTLNPAQAKKLMAQKNTMKFYHVGVIADKKIALVLEEKTHQLTPIKMGGYKHF